MSTLTATLPVPLRRVTRRTASFPSIALTTAGLPIEVHLVARLGHGTGTQLFHDVLARQRQHPRFVDELQEPSAKLGASHFALGDATALYSFAVGHQGHPYHRHAGHRVFTAIAGSGGAQLRFSTATSAEIAADPTSFVRALRFVNVPADCLFTVRFSGENWHQFVPLQAGSRHPAFFALSTHTNELGGNLDEALRHQVLADQASIPSLTELLPADVARLAQTALQIPTTVLALGDEPGGLMDALCQRYRSAAGRLARWRVQVGFISEHKTSPVQANAELPDDALLRSELNHRRVHHQDCFSMTVEAKHDEAEKHLANLLQGFLAHRDRSVSRLMELRNVLVRPFNLRTSPLACPVSSLLAEASPQVFFRQFPVYTAKVSEDKRHAQVILGADDKHLVFRSCVAALCLGDGRVTFSLSTRVACNNVFGRIYLWLIAGVHQGYIAPRVLEAAVNGIRDGICDQTTTGSPHAPFSEAC